MKIFTRLKILLRLGNELTALENEQSREGFMGAL